MHFNEFIFPMNSNEFFRQVLVKFDCFTSQFCKWQLRLDLSLHLQLSGVFQTPDGEFHYGIWGQCAFPVVQRAQNKNLLNVQPSLEPLHTFRSHVFNTTQR